MTIKLEKIMDEENLTINYRIKKSFFKNLSLTESELILLYRLLKREIESTDLIHRIKKVKL